jgi:predicted glycosyltransferase
MNTLRRHGPGALRILLYGQSLSGTGHFVRIYEIACALAARHDVYLVDGGRPVPRPRPAHSFAFVSVPRICRRARQIVPVDATASLESVMAERRRALFSALERVRPDALVIEHFPLSKWGLREEIVPIIEHARQVQPSIRVIASLRDIPPGTGDDPAAPAYRAYVLETLHSLFDGVLVHTDPALIALEEHIPWTDEIAVPIACTGYVSEKLGERPAIGGGHVVVSTGGAYLPGLVRLSLEAWRRLRTAGATGAHRLVVFLPPFEQVEPYASPADDPSVRFEPFTPDFLTWMAAVELSISQAGYNTCANVLETRARAILVPNAAMSDQGPRARRLAERGLAHAIPSGEITADRLASTMLEALAGRRPAHNVDLGGALKTCTQIEEWCLQPTGPSTMGGTRQS